MPDEWKEKYLTKVGEWEKENNQSSTISSQNLKTELSAVKTKIDRLTDGYLEGVFELIEFQEKKNILMSQKKDIEEKLSNLERKGNHWLELVKNWIIEANQAQNLVLSQNFSEMKQFLKTVGSNHRIVGGRLNVSFAKPWNWLGEANAERRSREAGKLEKSKNLRMWTLRESNSHLLVANEACCRYTKGPNYLTKITLTFISLSLIS